MPCPVCFCSWPTPAHPARLWSGISCSGPLSLAHASIWITGLCYIFNNHFDQKLSVLFVSAISQLRKKWCLRLQILPSGACRLRWNSECCGRCVFPGFTGTGGRGIQSCLLGSEIAIWKKWTFQNLLSILLYWHTLLQCSNKDTLKNKNRCY